MALILGNNVAKKVAPSNDIHIVPAHPVNSPLEREKAPHANRSQMQLVVNNSSSISHHYPQPTSRRADQRTQTYLDSKGTPLEPMKFGLNPGTIRLNSLAEAAKSLA